MKCGEKYNREDKKGFSLSVGSWLWSEGKDYP